MRELGHGGNGIVGISWTQRRTRGVDKLRVRVFSDNSGEYKESGSKISTDDSTLGFVYNNQRRPAWFLAFHS